MRTRVLSMFNRMWFVVSTDYTIMELVSPLLYAYADLRVDGLISRGLPGGVGIDIDVTRYSLVCTFGENDEWGIFLCELPLIEGYGRVLDLERAFNLRSEIMIFVRHGFALKTLATIEIVRFVCEANDTTRVYVYVKALFDRAQMADWSNAFQLVLVTLGTDTSVDKLPLGGFEPCEHIRNCVTISPPALSSTTWSVALDSRIDVNRDAEPSRLYEPAFLVLSGSISTIRLVSGERYSCYRFMIGGPVLGGLISPTRDRRVVTLSKTHRGENVNVIGVVVVAHAFERQLCEVPSKPTLTYKRQLLRTDALFDGVPVRCLATTYDWPEALRAFVANRATALDISCVGNLRDLAHDCESIISASS